jgi:RNA polymerase sigma factor (sigma-70 family)
MHLAYKQSEKELIAACIKCDRIAQKRLYEQHFGKLMGVCMRYASCYDEATIMLNNGFFKIFTSLQKFDSTNGNFEGWMYRIIVRTAIDHLRSEARFQFSEVDTTVYAEDNYNVVSEMEAEDIIKLVNQLSPAYRTVFNLYVVDGYTHAEIAGILGISDGTSKSNLAKAKAKLQSMITKQESIKSKTYE